MVQCVISQLQGQTGFRRLAWPAAPALSLSTYRHCILLLCTAEPVSQLQCTQDCFAAKLS